MRKKDKKNVLTIKDPFQRNNQLLGNVENEVSLWFAFSKLEVKVIKKFYVLRKLRNLYSAAFLSVYFFRKDAALLGLNYRLFALLNDCLTLPFSFFRSFAWNHTLPWKWFGYISVNLHQVINFHSQSLFSQKRNCFYDWSFRGWHKFLNVR